MHEPFRYQFKIRHRMTRYCELQVVCTTTVLVLASLSSTSRLEAIVLDETKLGGCLSACRNGSLFTRTTRVVDSESATLAHL